jgi:hypothetical protein
VAPQICSNLGADLEQDSVTNIITNAHVDATKTIKTASCGDTSNQQVDMQRFYFGLVPCTREYIGPMSFSFVYLLTSTDEI